TVEAALPLAVAQSVLKPDVVRENAVGYFTFEYRNAGNRDIPFLRARVLFPAGAALAAITSTGKLKKRSDLWPRLYAPLDGDAERVIDPGHDFPLEVVDLWAANLAPGEKVSCTVGVKGFTRSPFSVRSLAGTEESQDFLNRVVAEAETLRQALLVN